MARTQYRINLLSSEKNELERLIRKQTTPQHIAKRARIILYAEEFLCKSDKSIVFHYTPKHASWMNQIEIWFGILSRKVVKRGNFRSKEELRDKLMAFIAYFNKTLAKPFRWTYQGKPLIA
ncbi:MAG: transposase [Sulfuricellaceae bacterium]